MIHCVINSDKQNQKTSLMCVLTSEYWGYLTHAAHMSEVIESFVDLFTTNLSATFHNDRT